MQKGWNVRIYRQSITKDGQSRKTATWYADVYIDGKRHRLPLYKSKPLAEKTARRLEELIGLKMAGEAPGADLQRWLAQQTPNLTKRLASIGLVPRSRIAAGESLSKHIEAFKAHLLAAGVSSKQAEQQARRAERVLAEAGCRTLHDIHIGNLLLAIDRLKKQVVKKNPKTGAVESTDTACCLSPRSKQHHVRAIKQITKWLATERALAADPLANLSIKNIREIKHRRALTPDEAGYLIEWVSARGGDAYNLSGPERALIYRLALETGLRRNEIRSLKRTSFDFEARTVRVDSAYTKNRKAAVLPVKAATMALLKEHLRGKLPTAPAFGLTDNHSAKMIQNDLTAARKHWLEAAKDNPLEYRRRAESDFLKAETYEGKVDFHALRHTFATWLVERGIDIKTAQALLRHSTPTMTLGIYAHAHSENLSAAVNDLPDFANDETSEYVKKA